MGKWLLTLLVLGFSFLHSFAESVPVFRSVHVLPHAGGPIFPTQIAVDSQENTIIAGGFEGPELTLGQIVHTNRGATDGFIAKLDSAGNVLWGRRIGGSSSDYIHGMAVDSSDNVFFAATLWSTNVSFGGISLTTTSNHMSVVFKLDGNTGATLWHRKLDGVSSDGWATSLGLDTQDNVIVSGTFLNGVIFLRKINSVGDTVWTTQHGRCNLWGPNLHVTGSGQFFISGGFTNAGASFGHITITNSASSTGFAAKYGTDGNVLWAIPVQSEDYTDMTADTEGNAYLLDRSVSLTKITSTGEMGWKKQVVPPHGAAPASLSASSDGGILFTGSSYEDGVVVKYSATGEELWRKSSDSRRHQELGADQTAWISFFSRTITDRHGRLYFAGTISPRRPDSNCAFDAITFDPVPTGLIVVTAAHTPTLSRSLNGNFLTLSWPTNEPGFLLESSDLLTGDWQAIPEAVSISNGAHTVTREISGAQRFHRLRKPLP